MPTGTADSYSIAQGGAVYAGFAPSLPAWLQGAAVHEWVEISGTAFVNHTVASPSCIDAWGCLVPIDGTGTLVSPANGGHTDAADNGVDSIDLAADAPAWTRRISKTPDAQVTANATHNADGKPNSRHGYVYAHYIPQRSRVMLFGGRGFYVNGGDGYAVDGHTVSGTWAWDAAGTWTALQPGRAFGAVRDASTGNVLTQEGWLWNQAANTWSQLGSFTPGWRYPLAYDSTRGQFFALQWGDGGPDAASSGTVAMKINKTTGAGTTITLSGTGLSQWNTDGATTAPGGGSLLHYAGMDYDPDNDRFLFYAGRGTGAGRVYVITPNSGSAWDISILSLTGTEPSAAVNAGINGRFRYIAGLKGFVVCTAAAHNLRFFRVA